MESILIIGGILTIVTIALSAWLGYLLGKGEGASKLVFVTTVNLAVFTAIVLVLYKFLEIKLAWGEGVLAFAAVVLATWLDYFFNGNIFITMIGNPSRIGDGAALAHKAIIAMTLCLLATKWGWIGLIVAMILVGVLAVGFHGISNSNGARCIAFLWLWFCALYLLIYKHGTWVGVFTIVLPNLILFWGGLLFLARFILPPQEGIENWRLQAFRSLLAFTLGTNRPYYVIEDWKKGEKPQPRVNGDAYRQFWAGPGIIITGCDQLVCIATGLDFRGERPPMNKNTPKLTFASAPGLTFTDMYEEIYAVIDLRPQLRKFNVTARTKDGIPVSIVNFWPCRINVGDYRSPMIDEKGYISGDAYPYDKEAILRVVARQHIRHNWNDNTDERARVDWDDLVSNIAPPIVQSVIAEYKCNELHAPGDPRVGIRKKIFDRLSVELKLFDLELVGGGISNIEPIRDKDDKSEILKQRINNWKAEYKRKIEHEVAELRAKYIQEEEKMRTECRIKFIERIAKEFEKGDVAEEVLDFRLAEIIERMLMNVDVNELLREEMLRDEIERIESPIGRFKPIIGSLKRYG